MKGTIALFDAEGKPAGYFEFDKMDDKSFGTLITDIMLWVGVKKIVIENRRFR